eukprot:TRINITY_DN12305_c0_g2_i1.p2 TRINITY_DN12305_c0_g2~~TRINITY_DN12305_c0_g2_i1.p2  ORF type:complete len:152 (+),score=24.21 TRINITY_DN12305_c0_g2_i1:1357-1812(+)
MAKIAIVTGASRGIGAAIAKLLAQDGYAVAVNYAHNEEKANQVVESIKQGGGKAIAVQANVGDEAKVVAMFERVDKELGTLTALINNAAIIGVRGRVDELSLEDMQASLNTNVVRENKHEGWALEAWYLNDLNATCLSHCSFARCITFPCC